MRLYVWNVKFDQVRGAEHVCKAMWGFGIFPLFTDPKILEKEIYHCRNGGTVRTETGTIELVGWFGAVKKYCETVNRASELMTEYMKEVAPGVSDPKKFADKWTDKISKKRQSLVVVE